MLASLDYAAPRFDQPAGEDMGSVVSNDKKVQVNSGNDDVENCHRIGSRRRREKADSEVNVKLNKKRNTAGRVESFSINAPINAYVVVGVD